MYTYTYCTVVYRCTEPVYCKIFNYLGDEMFVMTILADRGAGVKVSVAET